MRDISMPRLLAADLDDRSVNLASYGRSVFFDQLFHIILWACGLIGFLLPVLIIGYLLIHGSHSLSWAFLFDHPRGAPLGTAGGIGPAIQGSFALALCGLLMAFPLALAGGVYLSEYGRSRIFNDSARFIVECLAAVPSVIYGLFGYAFLVVFLKFGISLLAGSIVLALIMFPIMLISIQEAFRAVDPGYRETALSEMHARAGYAEFGGDDVDEGGLVALAARLRHRIEVQVAPGIEAREDFVPGRASGDFLFSGHFSHPVTRNGMILAPDLIPSR